MEELLLQEIAKLRAELDRLRRELREHTRNPQGRASREFPHPTFLLDSAEVPGRHRITGEGIVFSSPSGRSVRNGLYFLARLSNQPSAVTPRAEVTADVAATATLRIKADEVQLAQYLVLEPLTSDPSSAPDGAIWYRSDIGALRVKLGGTVYSISVS